MTTVGKLAPCVLGKASNGVSQFNLYLDGRNYGSYPLNGPHDEAVAEQIRMAVLDAQAYGYDGICFYTSNKELPN